MSTQTEATFAAGVEPHRRELHVHCYRMVGSFDEAEDLVQETFLRAWRHRSTFAGERPGSFRAWLYRIATNASLDSLNKSPKRLLPSQMGPASDPLGPAADPLDIPWLEPYPDHLLDGIAPSDEEPETAIVSKANIELAFLAALQLLPPRQRAVLILREVLGWSAKETADLLETSVASVTSALQRARVTMDEHVPARDWSPPAEASAQEQQVLDRFVDAFTRFDLDALAAILHEEVKADMPPYPMWHDGRAAMLTALERSWDPESITYQGEWRFIATRANRQPALAGYAKRPGEDVYRPIAVDVFRVENGVITALTAFGADRLASFGLPPSL